MSIEKIKFHKKVSNPVSFEVSEDPVSAKPVDKTKILNLIQKKPVDIITAEMYQSLNNWNKNYPKGRKNSQNNTESYGYKNGLQLEIDDLVNNLRTNTPRTQAQRRMRTALVQKIADSGSEDFYRSYIESSGYNDIIRQ